METGPRRRHGSFVALAAVVALAAPATRIVAQVEWTPTYGGRANHTIFHDTARATTVLFGGNSGAQVREDAWELANGASTWTARPIVNGPQPLSGHAIAYDSLRGEGIMFGGSTSNGMKSNKTWIWRGGGVSGGGQPTDPPGRSDHAMAYDELRGKIVMFGGTGSAGDLGDTWEWDGSDWTLRFPLTNPSARNRHCMAYDSNLQKVVLFGGLPGITLSNELWAWDGTDWTLLHDGSGSSVPTGRVSSVLAKDPATGGVVLFSGLGRGQTIDDTWVWSNGTWTRKQPTTQPRERLSHSATFDPATNRVIVAGGHLTDINFSRSQIVGAASDVWEWDGNDWSLRVAHGTPITRFGYATSYDRDRDRVVMFGGLTLDFTAQPELWEWDGTDWLEQPAAGPSFRENHAMAYDLARRRSVITGGSVGSSYNTLGEVWAWDGASWSRLQDLPDARYAHAMAYDSVRDRLVVFGGRVGLSSQYTQTWEASGDQAVWTVRNPTNAPPFQDAAAMAYDERRQRTVLLTFGTTDVEHWEWDGDDWLRVTTATTPPFGSIAYDAGRERLVVSDLGETWEYDGSDWVLVADDPPVYGQLVYDSVRNKVVAVSSDGSVWYFGPTHPATYATFGLGCAGSAGVPTLQVDRLPWIDCPFTLSFDNLPAGQPGIVLLGFSKTNWNGLALPIDLTIIGLTGCSLYTEIFFSFPIVNDGWTLQLPNRASLLGAPIYNQALILDPDTNPLGAVLTNAGEGVIGGK